MSVENKTAGKAAGEWGYTVAPAVVRAVRRVSPAFVRITFGGPGMDRVGNPGQTFDQRIKLIFPPVGRAPAAVADTADWHQHWAALPETERGSMRTYSLRDVRVGEDGATEIDVDFVLHLEPGLTGPASTWASQAAVDDEVLMVGPRRGWPEAGGLEYAPGDADEVVLVGDETAAPAIARILEDAPADLRGVAFIEVPSADDALPIAAPDGVRVVWLPRTGGRAHGELLRPALLAHLGSDGAAEPERDAAEPAADEPLLWETPTFSRLGEDLAEPAGSADSRYYWIAGESRVVTGLRRHLVTDLGVERARVAFMGYWRHGVAMRG